MADIEKYDMSFEDLMGREFASTACGCGGGCPACIECREILEGLTDDERKEYFDFLVLYADM